jgi:hypothetical protein
MSVPSSSTRFSYRTNPEFSDITERVESAIYEQKFDGAAADMLNADTISSELGLTDRRNTTLAPESHCVILSHPTTLRTLTSLITTVWKYTIE